MLSPSQRPDPATCAIARERPACAIARTSGAARSDGDSSSGDPPAKAPLSQTESAQASLGAKKKESNRKKLKFDRKIEHKKM